MRSRLFVLPLFLSLTALGGCQSAPEMTEQVDPETGLYVFDSAVFDKLALASPAKRAKYQAIYFAPLDLSSMEINTSRLDTGDRDWSLTATEKAKIVGYFADSVIAAFKDSPLPLARGPGEKTLTAEFSLDQFTPTAPKDDIRSRMVQSEIFTYHAGELRMSGWLRDSVTGQALGYIEDSDKVGDSLHLQQNDRVTNTRKLKNTFDKWTRAVADALAPAKNE